MRNFGRTLCIFLATLLSLGLTYAFYIVLDFNVFDYLSEQDNEADVVNLFYRIGNSSDTHHRAAPYEADVVIFDLEGETSRSHIAYALAQINALGPRRIVVDVIFPEAATIPPAETDSLCRVVAACGPTLVTACRVNDDGGVEHSFYTDSLDVACGAANNSLFYCRPEVGAPDGKMLPALAYLATDARLERSTDRYVNFRDRTFDILKFADLATLRAGDIAGKIVIVGDLKDRRDHKDLAFPVGGSTRVAGVVILAHTVATILGEDWIVRSPDGVGWTVAAVLTLLFVALCYRIGDSVRPIAACSLVIRGLRLLTVVLLLLAAYLIFAWFGVIVNLVYAMLAIAMSGFALDALDYGLVLMAGRNEKKRGKR